jgi:hypothetical protein
MTRSEAIAIITSKLEALDDERVITVADIVQDMANPAAPALNLTDTERAAIERSKDDFKARRHVLGRSVSCRNDCLYGRSQVEPSMRRVVRSPR